MRPTDQGFRKLYIVLSLSFSSTPARRPGRWSAGCRMQGNSLSPTRSCDHVRVSLTRCYLPYVGVVICTNTTSATM